MWVPATQSLEVSPVPPRVCVSGKWQSGARAPVEPRPSDVKHRCWNPQATHLPPMVTLFMTGTMHFIILFCYLKSFTFIARENVDN